MVLKGFMSRKKIKNWILDLIKLSIFLPLTQFWMIYGGLQYL